MKRKIALILIMLLFVALPGCRQTQGDIEIAATTLPVYEFTTTLCEGTNINVTRLITEEVSCLHDYTLQAKQMKSVENADRIVISGAGLEDFLDDILTDKAKLIDASGNIDIHCSESTHHDHDTHSHEQDSHIWLAPENAKTMAANICKQLSAAYPQHTDIFNTNLSRLNEKFDKLIAYANNELANISCREIITFHDGFSYMAEAFDLTILHTIEEESGSEASAAELIEMISIVSEHKIPAIFTEKNSSGAAASIIAAETDVRTYALDMAMSGDSYFTAMYNNIDTLKEALQ